jgi:cell division protein FtsL
VHHVIRITVFAAASVLTLAGCESHQANVDGLQKEYDRLAAQFQKNCSAEYYKVPPTLSPTCQDEKKQMDDEWKRLQEERANK